MKQCQWKDGDAGDNQRASEHNMTTVLANIAVSHTHADNEFFV